MKCDMCGKRYAYETNMGRHERQGHQGEWHSERNRNSGNVNKHEGTKHKEKQSRGTIV